MPRGSPGSGASQSAVRARKLRLASRRPSPTIRVTVLVTSGVAKVHTVGESTANESAMQTAKPQAYQRTESPPRTRVLATW